MIQDFSSITQVVLYVMKFCSKLKGNVPTFFNGEERKFEELFL